LSEREGTQVRGDVNTYFQDGMWHSRIQGEGQPFSSSPRQERAIEAGRERAQRDKVEHIVRNMNGLISERKSFRGDVREGQRLTG